MSAWVSNRSLRYTTQVYNLIQTALSSEFRRFLNLAAPARSLTASILFYQLADISIFIFAYAFLFRSNHDFATVAWFNLGFYCTLSLGYILNAKLLRSFTLRTMSIVGLLGQAVILSSLFFFPYSLTSPVVFGFGLALGVPMGLYWSSRLFLFTIEVPSKQREYVSGITNSAHSLFQIVVPAVIGWFIATAAPEIGLTRLLAYQVVAIGAALLFTLSGFSLHRHSAVEPHITRLRIPKVSKRWRWFRAFIFLGSIQFAISIAIPESLIVGYVGNETVLGMVSSGTQFLAGIALFLIGRVAQPKHRNTILVLSTLPLLVGSFTLLSNFSNTTILIYLLGMSIFDTFYWFIYFPLLSDIVDSQTNGSPETSYPFFIDHELWINAGRILSSIAFIWMVSTLEQSLAVQIAVVLAALTQLGLLFVSKNMHSAAELSAPTAEPLEIK